MNHIHFHAVFLALIIIRLVRDEIVIRDVFAAVIPNGIIFTFSVIKTNIHIAHEVGAFQESVFRT